MSQSDFARPMRVSIKTLQNQDVMQSTPAARKALLEQLLPLAFNRADVRDRDAMPRPTRLSG